MDGFNFQFSWGRVALLIGLLGLYYYLGGFTPPHVVEAGYSQGQFNRVWMLMLLLYCSGAMAVTVVEHEVGLFPPTSLRFLYVILGLILMGAAVGWLVSSRQAIEKQSVSVVMGRF